MELVPIIFTYITWGPTLHHHHINFQCDNEGLVAAISKGSSNDIIMMHLLRSLWFFHRILQHHHHSDTPTRSNEHNCDHLSHKKTNIGSLSNPILSPQPTHLLPLLLCIVSPQGLNWTSPQFLLVFLETLSSLYQT